jgi:predicted DNA-binding WGR domain protein
VCNQAKAAVKGNDWQDYTFEVRKAYAIRKREKKEAKERAKQDKNAQHIMGVIERRESAAEKKKINKAVKDKLKLEQKEQRKLESIEDRDVRVALEQELKNKKKLKKEKLTEKLSNEFSKYQYLECTQGTSNKFWECEIHPEAFETSIKFGRINGAPQPSNKSHASLLDAIKFMIKLVAQKIKKGYCGATMKSDTSSDQSQSSP